MPDNAADAEVRNLLNDLGPPEEIAAEARVGAGAPAPGVLPPPSGPWGALEICAVLGLTVGTFVIPFVGPIVGLGLAWSSPRWTRREKVAATALTLVPLVLILLLGVAFALTGPDGGSSPAIPADSQEGALR